jgi:hypothetical protein
MSENILLIFIYAHLRKLYDIPRSFKFLMMHIWLSLISQLSFGLAAMLYPPIRYWPALDRDGVRMLIQPKRLCMSEIPQWVPPDYVNLYHKINEPWPYDPPTAHVCFCLAGITKSAILGRVHRFTYRYIDPAVEYEETDPDLAQYLPDRKSRKPDLDYTLTFPDAHTYTITSAEGTETHTIANNRILL